MSRIRIFGMNKYENPTFLENTTKNLPSDAMNGDNFKPASKISSIDFPLNRHKISTKSKKKRFLFKFYFEKSEVKNNRILQLRKEKLEKYRIDYIPLCSDEDWEMMADFYAKDSQR